LLTPVRRALLSVSDKTGIVEFARELKERGIELLSTGGTAKLLVNHGITVKEVAEHTGFPEIMGGRLKTLHPKIHGGILADRDEPSHRADLEAQGIDREPRPQIPRAAFEMERHGYRSVVADRMREDYQARVQARLDRVAESAAPGPSSKPQSLEEIRREARENWLLMRQNRIQGRAQGQSGSEASLTSNKARDDDLGL